MRLGNIRCKVNISLPVIRSINVGNQVSRPADGIIVRLVLTRNDRQLIFSTFTSHILTLRTAGSAYCIHFPYIASSACRVRVASLPCLPQVYFPTNNTARLHAVAAPCRCANSSSFAGDANPGALLPSPLYCSGRNADITPS